MSTPNPTYRVPIAERFKLTPSGREHLAFLPTGPSEANEDAADTDDYGEPCAEYLLSLEKWEAVDAVLAGIIGLRSAGEQYLPMEPKEDEKAYQRRLKRARFAPWYKHLRNSAIAQVLRKPIQIVADGEVPITLAADLEDIDLQGNDLNSFCRELLEEAIDHGGVAVLVDYPVVSESGNQTLADLAALKLRPYWVNLKAEEIIDARYRRIGGVRMLAELRIKRAVERPIGRFGKELVYQVRHYFLSAEGCNWQLWEELKGKEGEIEYVMKDYGLINLPYIPIVPLTKFFAEPPMLEIANLNLAHYQSWNRLGQALHIAANPRLILYGYIKTPGQEMGGVDEALIFDNASGRAEWLVAESINFEAMERDVHSIESLMKSLAVSTMTGQKNAVESGLAKQMDRVQSDALLSVLAQSLQDTIDSCLAIHCAYLGEQRVPTCQVNRSFQISRMDYQDVKILSEMLQLGQISAQMFLAMLVAGEWLPEETDIEKVLQELNEPVEEILGN
jgi:Domain of unknown function (DUF4055)